MPYLIDGYNLLHALGMSPTRTSPDGLAWARRRLLRLLSDAHGPEVGDVTVVFDAAGPRHGPEEECVHGIHVLYAVHEPEADDLIEALIRRDPAPRSLVVVSNDHRVQRAAHRRNCVVLGCQAYLDVLDRLHRQTPPGPQEETEKGGTLTPEEADRWLREFRHLEQDPNWKEFSDPYGFGELM
jgi:predicted RNA-binding protein with PIN domain